MRLHLVDPTELRRAVPMSAAVSAMAHAFSSLSDGRARVPLRIHMDTGKLTTLAMPAHLPGADGYPEALCVKVVTVSGQNRERGLPSVQALVLIFDPETGAPAAVVEGASLTALRTGAASGLATRLLAGPDASVLAIFGAGVQARTQLEAVHLVRPLTAVRIVSRTGRSAKSWAEELAATGPPYSVEAMADPTAALEGADLVVAATDSAVPVFSGAEVRPGAHVNAVGSYTPGMREVDGELIRRARVFVDAREGALVEAGDLTGAFEAGEADPGVIAGELGEVVSGRVPGRTSREQLTLFKSVGSGAQDAVIAGLVLAAVRRGEVGRPAEL